MKALWTELMSANFFNIHRLHISHCTPCLPLHPPPPQKKIIIMNKKYYTTFVFNFSKVLLSSQEKLETMPIQNLGAGGRVESKHCVLWEMCKSNFSLFRSQFFSQGSGKDNKDFFDLQKGTNTFCLKEPGKHDHNHRGVQATQPVFWFDIKIQPA